MKRYSDSGHFVTSLMWESSFVCLIGLLLSGPELKNFKYLSLEPRFCPDPRIRIFFPDPDPAPEPQKIQKNTDPDPQPC